MRRAMDTEARPLREQIRVWLARQISGVESVRGCSLNGEADIVAVTWGGSFIHVHLLDHLPKTRALKRQIQDNTRIGIGTLYIIDAALLPADGAKFVPHEVVSALHALYKDKIYTYRLRDEQPQIGQVHLRSFGRGDERELWAGPDVPVISLPSYRVWVRHPHGIRGDYLVANFGSEAFWKHSSYASERDTVRRQQRSSTEHVAWSRDSFGNKRVDEEAPQQAPPRQPAAATRLDRSYSQLGLKPGASDDDVKAAFRKLARALHPDVSTLPKDEAESQFRVISEAYALIKLSRGW